jgi:hypothetical protein
MELICTLINAGILAYGGVMDYKNVSLPIWFLYFSC